MDGSAWTSASSGTTTLIDGIWGSGASDVWAVGDAATLLHWDGRVWTNLRIGLSFRGVWGSGASDVWAVADIGFIMHWDGGGWTSFSSGTSNSLYGVWGSGTSDVWAVGFGGTILERRP